MGLLTRDCIAAPFPSAATLRRQGGDEHGHEHSHRHVTEPQPLLVTMSVSIQTSTRALLRGEARMDSKPTTQGRGRAPLHATGRWFTSIANVRASHEWCRSNGRQQDCVRMVRTTSERSSALQRGASRPTCLLRGGRVVKLFTHEIGRTAVA